MPVRKRERGSGVWGASRTVDETGVWWTGQCGRPGRGRCQPVRSQCLALGWAWAGIGAGNGLLE